MMRWWTCERFGGLHSTVSDQPVSKKRALFVIWRNWNAQSRCRVSLVIVQNMGNMGELPKEIWSQIIAAAIAHVDDRFRIRALVRLSAVATPLYHAVFSSPEMWRDVTVPALEDGAVESICRVLARLPRNSVWSLVSSGSLRATHVMFDVLERHADSLNLLGITRRPEITSVARDIVSRWAPAWSLLHTLSSMVLNVDVRNGSHLPCLPPLPALDIMWLDIQGGSVAAAPVVLGAQPSLRFLILHAERKDPTLGPDDRVPALTPWLAASLPSLATLHVSMLQGDPDDAFPPTTQLTQVTELELTAAHRPTSYAFMRTFTGVQQAIVHIRSCARNLTPHEPIHPDTLRPWSRVRQLGLTRVPLGPGGAPLHCLTALQKLQLDRCGLHDLGDMGRHPHLTSLWVRGPLTATDGVGALTALTDLSIMSRSLEDGSDLLRLTRLRNLVLDVSPSYFPTPWHLPSFVASLETVWMTHDALGGGGPEPMSAENVAPMPVLQTMSVSGGTMWEAGPLLERASGSPRLRCLRWTGVVCPEFASTYPRATAALARRKRPEYA